MNKPSNHQILVSGIGMISAAGNDVDANFANMLNGKRNPKTLPTIFSSEISKSVFECDDKLLDASLLPKRRTFALSLVALAEALSDAGLQPEDLQQMKVGVCIGTTVACTLNDLDFYSKVRSGEKPDILPLKRYFCGDISLEVANLLNLGGHTGQPPLYVPTLSVVNACASGTNAIAVGYSWIKSGACDLVIAGGADELNLIPYCGFNSLQIMSDEVCLPFDDRRKGLNLGEGAGILILESRELAEKRGVEQCVELRACGGGSDAYHITGPHPEGKGLKLAISQALSKADMKPEDIDYINAHGTATQNNDQVESAVFADVFGQDILFSSSKYFTGHTLGAAGAIEAAVCVKGIREGLFPGMVDIQQGKDVAVAPTLGEINFQGGGVLSTSMAFGGSCAVLLFAKSKSDVCIKRTVPNRPVLLKSQTIDDSLGNVIKRIESVSAFPFETSMRCVSSGVIGPFGWGKEDFKDALDGSCSLLQRGRAKLEKTTASLRINDMRISQIPEEVLKDPRLKKVRRRADRLSLAMLCAAIEAAETATEKNGRDWQEGKITALIAVTPFGPYKMTFQFLDGLLDYGQLAPSPTHFSNSVHNAPAFYITSSLNITGSSVTFSGFNNPFIQAVKLSENMLQEKECDQVLLVVGDEVCDAMLDMSKLWFTEFDDNIPHMWGEGVVAFLLNKDDDGENSPHLKSAELATAAMTEKIIGKTLINDAFAMAAEMC
jgi:3-oxoacyl-[acyl-carrier-protein] synthase II